ncbi:MAG: delta-60 repeat domain-containing protein [Verrucomicrobiales bacterium]|nr:delta-60 repeat domain-containing protein [Verrucomicrobiales bacterium]
MAQEQRHARQLEFAEREKRFGALVEQADGKILVARDVGDYFGPRGTVVRLLQDGKRDPAFQTGLATPSGYGSSSFYSASNPTVQALAVDAQGRILLGGWFVHFATYSVEGPQGQSSGPLARLNPDGSLDPTFRPDLEGTVTKVWPQADGKVLLAGNFPSRTVPGENDLCSASQPRRASHVSRI